MGEVFLARDTTLERDVAIKVLPAALSADPIARGHFTPAAGYATTREEVMT
jgi:hypothetical protein